MLSPKYRLDWSDFDREPLNGTVANPVWDDVRALVEHLASNDDTGGFIILGQGEGDYIQCARQDDGLVVEYHEPDKNQHFVIAGSPVDADEAVALFRAWFDNPRTIDEHGEWESLKL